ncbi:serine carboxypeptidase domain-containing protein [Phthorimaea operculella]|nr:serine carboxypeptidase domain-containing protein [Phthorimaea operculella]
MNSTTSLLMFLVVLTVPLTAVTVNSALCPTNKIAPHRRIARGFNVYNGRTLGAFYDLLSPGAGGGPGYDPGLQEEPQRDDPDDCGDIDDYDEHDLSALTPNYPNNQRGDTYGYTDRESRLFFGLLNQPGGQTPEYPPQGNPQYPQQPQYPPNGPQYPPNRPQYPPNRPQYPPNRPQYPPNNPQYPPNRPQYPPNRPQYPPQRPTRPPYSSGGYFENNPYRPPMHDYPSDDIKPVHDGVQEPQTTYRPHVVGGPSGHVIGVSPVSVQQRPTRRPEYTITRSPNYNQYQNQGTRTPTHDRYPQPTTQQPYVFPTRPSRPRQMNSSSGGCACEETNPYTEALNVRPWKSIQRYVEVRPGAFLFYWLYYADGTAVGADQKPLIIWIQGGPGFAASGLANFAEIGPLDMDMKPRNHTWVNGRNVLLIDHPVGTGFSYATDKSLYVKTDREMALDLHKAINFLSETQAVSQNAYLRRRAELRRETDTHTGMAIETKRLKMNFKGIGIGSGWVNPRESTMMQPQFLYATGIFDQIMYSRTMKIAKDVGEYIDSKNYTMAQITLMKLQNTLSECNFDINLFNINKPSPYSELDKLSKKINNYVKPSLSHVVNQSREWNYISDAVFEAIATSLLQPSTKYLEMLLENSQLKVAVYNGNLDGVTPLSGASNWVHRLNWHGAQAFRGAARIPIRGMTNGFYKTAGRMSFWGVFRAGHWVPEENPEAMEHILEHLMSDAVYSYSTK